MSKAFMKALVGIWVLLVVAALPVFGEDKAQAKGAYAVIVGVSDYADKAITARPHAEDDAKSLFDVVTDKKYIGVPADHVRLLLGKEDKERKSEPATRDNVLKALAWVAKEAGRDDVVIFAFVGQGAPITDQGDRLCYYASDSTIKDRAKNAVAASDIAERLDKLKSQRFAAFVDISFKFPGAKDATLEWAADSAPFREFLGNEGKEEHTPAPGRVVFLATNGRMQSLDLDKNGIFMHLVVEGLKGAADKDGYEPDGIVTVDELSEYVTKQLPILARKYGKKKEEKEQLNFVLGGLAGHFALSKNPAVTAKVETNLTKLADLAKEKKISPDLAEEGRNLLSRMPKLEAQRSLRKEYQALVSGSLNADQFVEKRDNILENTKLKRSDALEYARKVMDAVSLIDRDYVKQVNKGDMVDWAVRGLYRRLDEKMPAEISERLSGVKEMKEPDLKMLLTDVRERLGKREDLDNNKDIDISLQRMMAHLDPYTTYFDAETVAKLEQDIKGRFPGIGIQIRKDIESDMLRVVTPIKGSPAYKAGIQEGDILSQITREVDSQGKALPQPEVLTTKGMAINEAVKKITGKPGTKVKVSVQREGEDKPIEYELKRAYVELESVLGAKRKTDDSWDYMIDPVSKIGYIRLTNFARNSARDMSTVVKELNEQKIQGLVLDLRFNPGGLLDSAVHISETFIDDGLVVSIKPRQGKEVKFTAQNERAFTRFPMVCLVNGGSASGSEIVSAALQDHKRALIMGERSYGKGSVQNIQPFEGGEIKLTTASFWRPNGKNLNKSSTGGKDEDQWGVSPDRGHEIKLSRKEREDLAEYQREQEIIHRKDGIEKQAKEFKDRQLDHALEYLRGQIKLTLRIPMKKAG